MLRFLKMFTMAMIASAGMAATAMAQDAIGRAFSDALFEEQQITESVREHPEVSGLSKEEMNAALQARDALTAFFASLSSRGAVSQHLGPSLAPKYGDVMTLRRERFGAETYLSYEIFDFRVNEGMTRVKFRYFLAENDRGKALIRQRAITLDNLGGGWKITEFDNFDFD